MANCAIILGYKDYITPNCGIRAAIVPGGGTIVSVHPCRVAVLCLERAQVASLNRMEKYDGSKSSCSLLPSRSASSG